MQTPQHTPPQPSPAVVSVDPRHYTHDHASHEPPKAPRLQPAGASSTSKSRYIKSRQSAPDLSTALARAHILPHGHREAQARLQPLQPDDRAAFGLLTAAPSIAPSIGKLRKRIRIPQTRVPQLTQKGVALAINVSFHSLAQPGHGVRIMRLLDPKGKYDADLKEGSELAFPVERRRVHLGIYVSRRARSEIVDSWILSAVAWLRAAYEPPPWDGVFDKAPAREGSGAIPLRLDGNAEGELHGTHVFMLITHARCSAPPGRPRRLPGLGDLPRAHKTGGCGARRADLHRRRAIFDGSLRHFFMSVPLSYTTVSSRMEWVCISHELDEVLSSCVYGIPTPHLGCHIGSTSASTFSLRPHHLRTTRARATTRMPARRACACAGDHDPVASRVSPEVVSVTSFGPPNGPSSWFNTSGIRFCYFPLPLLRSSL